MEKFGKNILEAYQYLRRLNIGYKVKTENCDIEQILCGFVPLPYHTENNQYDNCFICTDNFVVGYKNIKVNLAQITWNKVNDIVSILPIAKHIEAGRGKVLVSSYIKLVDADPKALKIYQQQIVAKTAKSSYPIKPIERFEDTDKGKFFVLNDSDIIFQRENDVLAVAYSFLCLCSYINPVTGGISYSLNSPDSIYPVISFDDL